MAAEQWHTARLSGFDDLTEDTRRFFLEAIDGSVEFKPGQFITLDLPIHEKRIRRWRSYSLANAPNGNTMELVIKHVPGGAATRYLWEQVEPGTLLQYKGPQGTFVLPDEILTDLCLVATNTGVAPFRSMLLDLLQRPRSHHRIYLVFGTRYLSGLLYRDDFERLQQELPGFEYHYTLSRESSPDYTGRRGYVHAIYEELFADLRPAHFFLCGWRNMIDEARHRLLQMGYTPRQIHVELYG
ncbi:MAG: FAD-binding oxidoreductase [Chitinophagales bacterium]|nr:FAD-binding oxidoreductase [Chitinophagales bacterium]MDW8394123.1 FAD-binding oxidoreductase [Chitinophagales bacterium]